MGWVSPTSASGWTNNNCVYDNNTGTYAYIETAALSWSGFITINRASTVCSKVRCYILNDLGNTQHDLDVYYSGAWHHIYSGLWTDRTWVEKSLGGNYNITAIRIRGYNGLSTDPINVIVYEVDFYQELPPTVTTQAVSSVGSVTATGNGNITDIGTLTPTKRGVCYNTTGSPTIADDYVEEEGSFGTGAFTSSMTGLSPGVKYYVKAYAYNAAGYSYGGEVNFTTDKVEPTVTCQDPTDVLPTTATGNGNITALGGENANRRGFEYGLTKNDPDEVHDDGSFGTGAYTKGITGLVANTTYWIRAYARNSIGTSYSDWTSFQTAAAGVIPTGTKIEICGDYTGYTFKSQRSETDDGDAYTAYFVISTDLSNKQALAIYKRILDLHLYFKSEDSGTATITVKRDNEAEWQAVGSVSLTGTAEIIVKHLATRIYAKHFLFKISAANAFRFLGCLFEFLPEGMR